MADKKISDLTTASILNESDNIEISQTINNTLASFKTSILQIAIKILKGINFANDLNTVDKTIIGAINESAGVVLSDTLEAGETTITFTNNAITTDSMIDYYTDVFGVVPSNITVTTGSVELTFDSQANDLGVKVIIR
ncbi:MAG: hypothetical protein J5725_00790 [Bacteroidales bacterium]|nr:hypothetical protein [Bacteroidales bacterium]